MNKSVHLYVYCVLSISCLENVLCSHFVHSFRQSCIHFFLQRKDMNCIDRSAICEATSVYLFWRIGVQICPDFGQILQNKNFLETEFVNTWTEAAKPDSGLFTPAISGFRGFKKKNSRRDGIISLGPVIKQNLIKVTQIILSSISVRNTLFHRKILDEFVIS